MEILHFDFTRDARRSSIVSQVKVPLHDAGWAAATTEAMRAGVPKRHHANIAEVRETIAGLTVAQRTKDDLLAVYEILAEAEAQVHGCAVEETHFHEVGNAEAIMNSLVICCGIAHLIPKRITATPVQVGSGQVECSHGLLDIPAPATAAILATGIPVCDEKLEGELCTPTSAAIIKHFVDEFVDGTLNDVG